MTATAVNGDTRATGNPIDLVLPLLGDAKKTARGWRVRCPAHADENPSLDVDLGDDGRVLFSCRSAGCKAESICAAIGLRVADLYPRENWHGGNGKAKLGKIVATYDYTDAAGNVVFQAVRFAPKDFRQRRRDSKGKDGWTWNLKGVTRVLYRLPELLEAPKERVVFVVEGEKDVDRLRSLGLIATTNAMGAGKWLTDYNESLRGRHVVVLPDNDPPGRDHAEAVAKSLTGVAASVKILGLPNLQAKGDVSDWLDAGGTVEQLRQRVKESPEWAPGGTTDDSGDGRADAWEGRDYESEPAPDDPPREAPIRFDLMDSAAFAHAEFNLEWLIRGALVASQPAVVGGPKKSLKTSAMVDMALSLATGTPFLGRFPVDTPVRTALLSGESGEAVLQETARRIAAAKGIALEEADVRWGFKLPRFTDAQQLAALQESLAENAVKVCIFDPLYLALLGGRDSRGPQASNLYEMGPLLLAVAQTCLAVGCTPALAHHFRLTRADHYAEPQLEDLAFSGIQEFARQWILMGRRERYEPGTGSHRLWLAVGGSAGHSSAWALDIEEGTLADDFTGRRWDVSTTTASEIRRNDRDTREQAQREGRAIKDHEDDAELCRVIDRQAANGEPAVGYTRARDLSGLGGAKFQRAVERLISAGILEEAKVTVRCNNGSREAKGLRRAKDGDDE
jgi:hypothetical protein